MVHVMYYRINTIFFDASRKDEFIAYFGTMRDEMKKIAGVQSITIIETGEGEATQQQPPFRHAGSTAAVLEP